MTALIRRWQAGEAEAAEELFAHTFRVLRQLAGRQMRASGDSELQPTELVSEGVLRLLQHVPREIADRHHFVAIAGYAMRQALAERARRRGAGKRPQPADRRELATDLVELTLNPDSLVDLARAIDRLAELDRRQATIARLHLQAGCTIEECAEALGTSVSTARRQWRGARVWLRRELREYLDDG
ncbi:MAG: sigma-70 family RNA polymerase sigma factor [bacterium]|nr:sigma-70 family RNA polymerase sigma factor [bacterium]